MSRNIHVHQVFIQGNQQEEYTLHRAFQREDADLVGCERSQFVHVEVRLLASEGKVFCTE